MLKRVLKVFRIGIALAVIVGIVYLVSLGKPLTEMNQEQQVLALAIGSVIVLYGLFVSPTEDEEREAFRQFFSNLKSDEDSLYPSGDPNCNHENAEQIITAAGYDMVCPDCGARWTAYYFS